MARGGKLSDQERAFVIAYVENGHNGAAAAITAGYSPRTAKVIASLMLKKAHIAAAIAAMEREVDARLSGEIGRTIPVTQAKPSAALSGEVITPTEGRSEDREKARMAQAAEAIALTRGFVITRIMRNLQLCMGEESRKIVKIVKIRSSEGKDVFEAVQVTAFEHDAAGANQAAAILLKELDAMEARGLLKEAPEEAAKPAFIRNPALAEQLRLFREGGMRRQADPPPKGNGAAHAMNGHGSMNGKGHHQ